MATYKLFASPYINFQGKAREAMEFYHKVLGGKLDMLAMDSSGNLHPASPEEKLMHARLLSSGAVIMATDGSSEHPPTWGDNMAVSLTGSDEEFMSKAFSELADGGKIKMPLSPASWGDKFGYLEDKYGVNWMIDITVPENMSID